MVAFSLSPALSIRGLQITGILKEKTPAAVLAKIEHAFEGVPLDARILSQVAKRAFQENSVAVAGIHPDELVRAILSA